MLEYASANRPEPQCPVHRGARLLGASDALIFAHPKRTSTLSYQAMNQWVLALLWLLRREFKTDIPKLLAIQTPKGFPSRLQAVLFFAMLRLDTRVLLFRHEQSVPINLVGKLTCFVPKLSKLVRARRATQKKPKKTIRTTPRMKGAVVVLTSGSTGEPKAVVCDAYAWMVSALGSVDALKFSPSSKVAFTLSWVHTGGMALLWRAMVSCASLVFFDAQFESLESKLQVGITHASMLPFQMHSLSSSVLSKLSCILFGGSAVSKKSMAHYQKISSPSDLFLSYGATETCASVALQPCNGATVILPHARLSFKDRDVLDAKEICISGDSVALGVLDHQGLQEIGQPWHSGDLGDLDANKRLSVDSRHDSLYKSGGHRIWPERLERELKSTLSLEDVFVLPLESKEWGNLNILACKIKDEDAKAGIQKALSVHNQKKLTHERIRGVVSLEKLTSSMNQDVKIARNTLIRELNAHKDWVEMR